MKIVTKDRGVRKRDIYKQLLEADNNTFCSK